MHSFYPLLTLLAPLIAALLTAPPRRCVSDRTYKFGFFFLLAGFTASLPLLWQAVQSPEATRVVLFAAPWNVLPPLALSIDRLAAIMMVVISSIGMLIYRYSRRYLQQDPGLARFMTLLALSISTLLFMVASADLVTLFITWQLLSWFLCLLSHNFAHLPTARSSFRTFIMLRAGDIAFLCGIALAFHLYGTVQIGRLFELAAADQTRFALFGNGLEITGPTAVTLLILIGATSKSAQFPLHMWLPDSLYAPTPIHALLHAGIINAGGFLLNRLAPLYALSPVTLHLVLLVGLCTIIFGKCMMLTKNDIKTTLGYSTIGQMGYMMMECGLGAFPLAVFHLIAHGLFKATVFLNCGDVIHKARLYPARPPKQTTDSPNLLRWVASFFVSLILPLVIIIGVHHALGISYLTQQGIFIFMLFSWVTAAHATLTLFRLDAKWTTMGAVLALIVLVSTAYFFAAEHFSYFLYPNPGAVAAYFQAAALPEGVFLASAALLVASIIVSWFMLYLHYQDRTAVRRGDIWARAYVFFMNRLYLDGISLRLFDSLKTAGRLLDRSRAALPIVALLALFLAWSQLARLPSSLPGTVVFLFLPALLVPLFPLHGLYTAALTRAPRSVSVVLSILLPVAGVSLMPNIPPELLPAVGILAAFGAVWGSVKALMQVRVLHLLSYAGLALYSVLWWHMAQAGKLTAQAVSYAWAVTLVIGGLVLAWDRLRIRYGDLDLNHIGGLFKPMPRFALCLGLLVMAGAGLPPFALCFGYLSILFSPSTGMSFGLLTVIAAWFAASWYLFKLMQRLLFGQHRTDLRYEDLRPAEIATFMLVIALLLVPVSLAQVRPGTRGPDVTWTIEGAS
jgi:NADH-quinone oxidoreductase subunit L